MLQGVKACEGLCSQPFYLRKAVQGCVCLMHLVHYISLLYVRVNSIMLCKLRYDSNYSDCNCTYFYFLLGELISKKLPDPQSHVDGSVFLLGLSTLLEQYPKEVFKGVVAYLTQYVRSFIAEQTG